MYSKKWMIAAIQAPGYFRSWLNGQSEQTV
jgi:hypothetical protein